jgi:hypothetical protein
MKKLYFVGKAVFTLAFVLSISSCATSSQNMELTLYGEGQNSGPRFADEASLNAVLQFSSWDYTFLVRPQYTAGGYLQQVRRENINQVFDQMKVRRGTAAVVVGWTYNGDDLKKLVSDWKTILGECGFQRVVILRAQLGNTLNGSVIVDDTSRQVGSIQNPARGSGGVAAFASATGADAAHTPGDSIR